MVQGKVALLCDFHKEWHVCGSANRWGHYGSYDPNSPPFGVDVSSEPLQRSLRASMSNKRPRHWRIAYGSDPERRSNWITDEVVENAIVERVQKHDYASFVTVADSVAGRAKWGDAIRVGEDSFFPIILVDMPQPCITDNDGVLYADQYAIVDGAVLRPEWQLLGEGTYGRVVRCANESGQAIALKLFKHPFGSDGDVSEEVYREMAMTRRFASGDFTASLKAIVMERPRVLGMAMECFSLNLKQYALTTECCSESLARVTEQVLCALTAFHFAGYAHRDLKPQNVVVDPTDYPPRARIIDLGLMRQVGDNRRGLTLPVCTLWYRPPEILLENARYDGCAVDVWSFGVMLYELYATTPLLKGKSDEEQLRLTFDLFGTPTHADWPGVEKLPLYANAARVTRASRLDDLVAERLPRDIYDLFRSLTAMDPQKRCTSRAALERWRVLHGNVLKAEPMAAR